MLTLKAACLSVKTHKYQFPGLCFDPNVDVINEISHGFLILYAVFYILARGCFYRVRKEEKIGFFFYF